MKCDQDHIEFTEKHRLHVAGSIEIDVHLDSPQKAYRSPGRRGFELPPRRAHALLVQSVGNRQALRVVGDEQVSIRTLGRSRGHLVDCGVPVAPHRMCLQVAEDAIKERSRSRCNLRPCQKTVTHQRRVNVLVEAAQARDLVSDPRPDAIQQRQRPTRVEQVAHLVTPGERGASGSPESASAHRVGVGFGSHVQKLAEDRIGREIHDGGVSAHHRSTRGSPGTLCSLRAEVVELVDTLA